MIEVFQAKREIVIRGRAIAELSAKLPAQIKELIELMEKARDTPTLLTKEELEKASKILETLYTKYADKVNAHWNYRIRSNGYQFNLSILELFFDARKYLLEKLEGFKLPTTWKVLVENRDRI